jgi:hypothetical protein
MAPKMNHRQKQYYSTSYSVFFSLVGMHGSSTMDGGKKREKEFRDDRNKCEDPYYWWLLLRSTSSLKAYVMKTLELEIRNRLSEQYWLDCKESSQKSLASSYSNQYVKRWLIGLFRIADVVGRNLSPGLRMSFFISWMHLTQNYLFSSKTTHVWMLLLVF